MKDAHFGNCCNTDWQRPTTQYAEKQEVKERPTYVRYRNLEITWLLFHCALRVHWSQQQNNDKTTSKLNDFKMERRPIIS